MRNRVLLRPKWLVGHALVAILFVTFLALGWWQVTRAENGNLRSFGYAAEWPLFAGFLIFFWVRILRIELHSIRRHEDDAAEAEQNGTTLPAEPVQDRLAAAFDPWGRRTAVPATPAELEPDPELDAYNAYLAHLAAADRAERNR